jgi:hypothetical protein
MMSKVLAILYFMGLGFAWGICYVVGFYTGEWLVSYAKAKYRERKARLRASWIPSKQVAA